MVRDARKGALLTMRDLSLRRPRNAAVSKDEAVICNNE